MIRKGTVWKNGMATLHLKELYCNTAIISEHLVSMKSFGGRSEKRNDNDESHRDWLPREGEEPHIYMVVWPSD